MPKAWNSTLEQRTPLKANKGLDRRTPLKTLKGRSFNSTLKPVSDKQKVKNAHWGEITDERCYELGFMCQWCGRSGQRNNPNGLDYLNGHHIIKRRYNIHTKKNCYIAHQFKCHQEIEDNNVDVDIYPDREAWLKSKERE